MQLASLSLAEKLKVIFHLCCAHLSSQRLMLPSLLAEEKKRRARKKSSDASYDTGSVAVSCNFFAVQFETRALSFCDCRLSVALAK